MSIHRTPPANESCLICFDDLCENNYVEYCICDNPEWHPSKFCDSCIEELRTTQFHHYVSLLNSTDCKRTFYRLLKKGPPINVSDRHGFPAAGAEEIQQIWLHKNGEVKINVC